MKTQEVRRDAGEESKFKGRNIPKAAERDTLRTKEKRVRGRDCVTAAKTIPR